MKKFSSPHKALDFFGQYDEENDGDITVSHLKKGLEHISVNFTDSEFNLVFGEYFTYLVINR